jgi:hypothetical protein
MKMKYNKFTTYEFEVELPGDGLNKRKRIEYKINNDNKDDSFMLVTDEETNEQLKLSVPLLVKLHEAMREVDPFCFDFDDNEEMPES